MDDVLKEGWDIIRGCPDALLRVAQKPGSTQMAEAVDKTQDLMSKVEVHQRNSVSLAKASLRESRSLGLQRS